MFIQGNILYETSLNSLKLRILREGLWGEVAQAHFSLKRLETLTRVGQSQGVSGPNENKNCSNLSKIEKNTRIEKKE